MELFSKIVDGFQLLTIFAKSFILDVCQVSDHTRMLQIAYQPNKFKTRPYTNKAMFQICLSDKQFP